MTAPEIDHAARRFTSKVYRRFAAGFITNDQMEAALPENSGHELNDIFFLGIWPLFDDLYEHRLTGKHRLTAEGRRHVARILLFLHSSLPYRWPAYTGWAPLKDRWTALVRWLFTGARPSRFKECGGDISVWPFFDQAEYHEALRVQPFLRGSSSARSIA